MNLLLDDLRFWANETLSIKKTSFPFGTSILSNVITEAYWNENWFVRNENL